jgi:hypothetical protein
MRAGISVMDDLADGSYNKNLLFQGAKTVFHVENNDGNDNNDGLSWETAYKTLAVGLAASHADIALNSKGWASRNVILFKGDSETADLVKLAQKTTVFGVGTKDGWGQASVVGNHVPNATAWPGCHFVNIDFYDADGNGAIWTVPATTSALKFFGCRFLAGATSTAAMIATNVTELRFYDCDFYGRYAASTGAWSTAAISIVGTGVAVHRQVIDGCRFDNITGDGIDIVASKLGHTCVISNNYFMGMALAVDDNSDTFYVINNQAMVSGSEANGTSMDIDLTKASDNRVTGSGGAIRIPQFTPTT